MDVLGACVQNGQNLAHLWHALRVLITNVNILYVYLDIVQDLCNHLLDESLLGESIS